MKKLIAIIMISGICSHFSAFGLPNFWDKEDNEVLTSQIINAMSDEELIGQVFFNGYTGFTFTDQLNYWIKEHTPGGIKVFTRNVKDLFSLACTINQMQMAAKQSRFSIPLLIATDQEGGTVRHIRDISMQSPGNLSLGATENLNDAYLTGYYIGLELNFIGFNMNFAPAVDIYSNPLNSAIGSRSFSSDPIQTGLFGLAYFHGMEAAGIISTAKHFPGHGEAELDSHGYLPEVDVDLKTMKERELIPYSFLIKEGLGAIMTGHIAFPRITGDIIPATLSPFFLKNVLRDQLDFKGILLTDDMEMYGVRSVVSSFTQLCYKAVTAGNDMLLISHSPAQQDLVFNYFLMLLKSDVSFKNRIVESVKRILLQKMHYFKSDYPMTIFPDCDNVYRNIIFLQRKYSQDFLFQSICRSITIIRDTDIPFTSKPGDKILIAGQYTEFLYQGRIRYPQADTFEFSYYPVYASSDEERSRIRKLSSGYDTIIFLLTNYNSFEVLSSLKDIKKRIIVISSQTPVLLSDLPWIKTALSVYGTDSNSFKAGFAVLSGDFTPEGKLPIALK